MVLPIKRTTTGDLSQIATGDTIDLPGNLRSDATASGRVIGTPTQGFNEILLNKHAATGNMATARSLAATTAGSPGAVLVGVDTTNLTNSAPAQGDLQTVLEALDAASGGGGGGDLQTAYDAGPDIVLDATGAVIVTDGGMSSNPDGAGLIIAADNISNHGIQITRTPGSPAFGGNGIDVVLAANANAQGVDVTTAGLGYALRGIATGFGSPGRFEGQGQSANATSVAQTDPAASNPALEVAHSGLGPAVNVLPTSDGVVVDMSAAGGGAAFRANIGFSTPAVGLDVDQGGNAAGAQVVVSNAASGGIAAIVEHQGNGTVLDLNAAGGTNTLINARAGLTPVLVVDPALVEVGEAANPIPVQAFDYIRTGESAADTTVKSHEAYTTPTGTDPADVANLGRLLMRPGTNTAPSTTADLALRAGSEGETLLTKGGRVYATAVLREFVIANGVTLALGDVVSPSGTTARVGKADPISANGNDNAFGICLVGGTGDVGGTVRALIVMGGYIDGLAGLTANTPVFLDDTTPGLLTSTPPSASGSTSIRIGFALSQSAVIVTIGEKVLIP